MNGGQKAGSDTIGVPGQLRQLVIADFSSSQVPSNARKSEARGTPLQPMQDFADVGRRLRGQIAKGSGELFTKRQQALLTQQGEQLGNPLLIDVLHGASPR
nr:hypothetical protein [uncultured Erythrobacter sp.]